MTPKQICKELTEMIEAIECGYPCERLSTLYNAVECITGLEAMLDATITESRAEIRRLEKALEAAREDMEEMACAMHATACQWCGVELLEECGKCTTCNEGFRWRGTSEYKPRKENGNVY